MNEICYNKVLDCAGKHQVRWDLLRNGVDLPQQGVHLLC
jgi:hypothetical protein